MDDFFICVMEMGECYWWMWLEVDGGLVVHKYGCQQVHFYDE